MGLFMFLPCYLLFFKVSSQELLCPVPAALVCHLLPPCVPGCAGCPREEHALGLETLFVSSLQLSAVAELFPHVSGSEQGSDRPVEGGDITLPLPRVPVQSGANWFGKKPCKPTGIKSIFWNCCLYFNPASLILLPWGPVLPTARQIIFLLPNEALHLCIL